MKASETINANYVLYDDLKSRKWASKSEKERESIIRQLVLLKRFNKNPNSLSVKFQKELLENADLETELVPNEIMDEKNLWL